jgi:hypothetical protein
VAKYFAGPWRVVIRFFHAQLSLVLDLVQPQFGSGVEGGSGAHPIGEFHGTRAFVGMADQIWRQDQEIGLLHLGAMGKGGH